MESNNVRHWFEDWFDENYLLLYHHRNCRDADVQVRLILDTLDIPTCSSILDLGCGEGRYTHLFRNRGYRVFGMDLSECLVREGRKRYGDLHLIVGDMRAIPGCFDVIVSLFTSFGYFPTREENACVLAAVYSALNPGGWFWIDFLNPPAVLKNLVSETVTHLPGNIEVTERRKIDDGRVIKDIFFNRDGDVSHYKESVALFSREELEMMLVEAGLGVVGCFGDYAGARWSPDAPRTVLYARKKP